MWDFSIPRSLGLMVKTVPFIVFRLIVYFGIAVAYVLVTGIGAGIGWGVGAFGGPDFHAVTTFWGGVIGFVVTAGALYLAREYILYLVKAGHLAVLVELLEGRDVPMGRPQIDYATAMVKERFIETHVLFAVQQLVRGVLAAITGIIQGVAAILPVPGLEQFVGLVKAFLRIAVGMIDQVILAYAFKTRATNPWASAETAVVLYAQNYKIMLKNAAWLTIITYVLAFLVFLVMLAPAGAVVWLIPGGWSAGGFIFAIVFAWAVKAALIEPFAISCMMQVYFKTIEGQQPDPAWEARIGAVSRKFTEMKERAIAWMSGGAPAAPATPAAPLPPRASGV
ncbi:MAG TPA: hypothetical protein VHB23_09855 [Devosiaceae bacterium]|jgi:hypothetical protein|nr:hypothetical protein [Devosiaceae bacterium]